MSSRADTVSLPQGSVSYRSSGSGETLVFLHGLFVSGRLWDPVIPLLAGEFRCVVPDLPLGSHRAAMRDEADLSPPGVARLVDDFLHALELEQVTLVGNDTGGAIAQLLAASHPDRLARLVLTPCDAYDNFLPPLFRYLQLAARIPGATTALVQPMRLRAIRRTPIGFGWLAKHGIADELLDEWVGPLVHDGAVRRDAGKFLRAISTRHTLAAAERLRSFDRPTLVAWAPEDRVFKQRYGERLAADIPGARLERIDDSYTFVPLDQPRRTADLIAEFVRSTSAVRA